MSQEKWVFLDDTFLELISLQNSKNVFEIRGLFIEDIKK